MQQDITSESLRGLIDSLNFAEKVDRSLGLIREAYQEFGDGLVVANSLGKDSVAVWHLAKRVNPDIRGFVVTTRFKPAETVEFMDQEVSRCPELKVFKNDESIPEGLY
ncbi:MAG: phosphoadenosine phosphosulfate reductase family protein, partial [Dehalococcoidia bacterium]|nr:phosphoadenosine phosphosulfate reductase family protein [Dehalococcoidia bacterium]